METFYEPDEILNFWFPNSQYQKWWFIGNTQLDQQIAEKYFNQMSNLFSNFKIGDYLDISVNKLLSDIILLDQFSRNISRIKSDIDVSAYTKKAQILSEIWLDKKYYLTEPIAYTVFALLPIRHSKDKNAIEKILPVLDEIKEINQNYSNPIYKKFYLHTIRSLQ